MAETLPASDREALPVGKIRKIGEFGRRYVKDFLSADIANREKYTGDWYESLKFFFSKSFYRGRRDEVSDNFRKKAFEVLDRHIKPQGEEEFNGGVLEEQLWNNGVNNETDRRMVRQTIEFVQGLPQKNITQYVVEKMKSNQPGQAHSELMRIFGVGDKIASFYLRDVALVYGLGGTIAEADFKYFQPVDTWVLQVARKLGITTRDYDLTRQKHIDEAKEKIIYACVKAGISPLLFNAGAWYAGAHSLELLLDSI